MFKKIIFYTFHVVFKPTIIFNYYRFKRNESKKQNTLLDKQRKKVELYINRNKKPYQSLLTEKSIYNKADINKINNKLITSFSKLKVGRTGGSTGEPLVYYMNKRYFNLAFSLTYRGWGRAGYKLGDRVAILAGGSLVNDKVSFKSKLVDYILNFDRYSSYGMDESLMLQYFHAIKNNKTKFLRGYVSSIFEFAKYIDRNSYTLSFKAVITTAEMLNEYQRTYIEQVFNCKVYNTYGLNDGGISAFECELHSGFHIDTERALLEVVNSKGEVVYDKIGHIIATSFTNTGGTPFIKYDTGDLGIITKKSCPCGSPYPLLKELKGRETDALEYNGKVIGSPVLTVLMSRLKVERYQFIQKSCKLLVVNIAPSDGYSEKDTDFLKKSLKDNVGDINIKVLMIKNDSDFVKTKAGKHKVVIKEF